MGFRRVARVQQRVLLAVAAFAVAGGSRFVQGLSAPDGRDVGTMTIDISPTATVSREETIAALRGAAQMWAEAVTDA